MWQKAYHIFIVRGWYTVILNPTTYWLVVRMKGITTFKITDYSGISSGVISQLSSRSSSLKQFMTPGYLAPELIGDVGDRFPPSKPSDIYSFGILTYEVYFCAEP